MQVNNIVCRCDNVDFKPTLEQLGPVNYRGNRLQIGSASLTLWVPRKNIRDTFFDISLASDLSQALSEYFQRKITVYPRISNLQGSKTFEFPRTVCKLKEFVRAVDNICKVEEIKICQEQNSYNNINIEHIWNEEVWQSNFIGITIKTNSGKLTCKFQIKKDKTKFVGTFILSEFGKFAQAFNKLLSEFE